MPAKMLARLSKRFMGSKEVKGWNEKATIDGYAYFYNNDTEEITWEKPVELMSKSEKEQMSGEFVFVPHPTRVWQAAKVVKTLEDGRVQVVSYPEGKKLFVKKGVMCDSLTAGRKQNVELWSVKLHSLNMPEDDLVMLDDVNDALVINNLEKRYEEDQLYTWVGAARSVLISVNPYKSISGLYGNDVIDKHRNRPPNAPLVPHVYDVANDSYDSMLYENKNQSVLISGESGAGKTVCTKQVLDFFAQVAGSKDKLEEKILLCNPLLEAFGNAQTIRNNNSSRFGKWIEVHFDNMERAITSASITNYLLEKSRVVHQQANSEERNYHIFYQLCKDESARAALSLQEPSEYNYLNQSGTYSAKEIDDVEEHAAVRDAMSRLAFSDEEIASVMQLTAGVLNLGNVEFSGKSKKNGVEGSTIADGTATGRVAALFGVEEAALAKVLTNRSISVRGKTSVIPLTPEKARTGTDSLAMAVYSNMFSWLVARVNDALDGPTGKMIGILDIFGFEIFENNSFEQLCINYCNEKLQQQFNQTTFKQEEALYVREGIDFVHVEFIDNQVVLDLIEKRPNGLLRMIDDETIVPEGADSKFMNKAESEHKRHPKFGTDKNRKLTDKLNFEIEHYAGVVNYNSDGFLAKNLDTLFQDMYDLCSGSSDAVMQAIFPEESGRRKIKSLGKQFRGQLTDLMDSLHSTESRYIRCIKPNAAQLRNSFQAGLVLDQLRYSGVFEAVSIRRQGFPFRLSYAQFACRYSCVNRGHRYSSRGKDHEKRCKEILSTSKQDFGDVRFGKTLLFYRSKEYKVLQLLRNLALETLIPRAQSAMRGHLAREVRRRLLKAEQAIADAIISSNDLPAMEAALESWTETVGTLAKLFPYEPRNLAQGEAHLAGLRRWKDLEETLEKLVDQDPNKVYYPLAEAVDAGKALRAEFDHPTDRQKALIEQAIDLRANSDLGKIDAQADEVLAVLDRDGMDALLTQARAFQHTTDVIKEIQRLLDLPDLEWYELEKAKAVELGDDDRRIRCEIKIKGLALDNSGQKYLDMATCDLLKDAAEYAKPSLFGKAKAAENFTVFSKKQVSALTKLTDGQDKLTTKAAEKEALRCSKLLRAYMANAKAGNLGPEQALSELAATGSRGSQPLQCEIFLQVLKQLRNNPDPESTTRGFRALLLLSGAFLPNRDVECFVLMHCNKNAPESFPPERFANAFNQVEFYNKASTPSPENVEERVEFLLDE